MPVGAGGEALRRIEAALAKDDPALVESFRRWGVSPEDPGGGHLTIVDRRMGLVLLLGLLYVSVGPMGVLVLLLLGGVLLACVLTARWSDQGLLPSPSAG